jgi:5-formyltetrahydrofolate cyclo-ligase
MEKNKLRKQYFRQFNEYQKKGDRIKAEKKIKQKLKLFFNQKIKDFENSDYNSRSNEEIKPKQTLFGLSFLQNIFNIKTTAKTFKIMAYQPMKSELPILRLLEGLPCEIFIPEIRGKNLIPRSIKTGLRKKLREMDFVITPGLYVNKKGFRLGRGGGFYDRLLCKYSACKTIFVGFDWQILSSIPLETHDRQVGHLITENRTISP